MKELSRVVQSIPPSGIRRFFDLIVGMEGVISLGVGEPDFVTPWAIREAAVYSLEKGYTMYTSNAGLPELRRAISRYLAARHGLEYDPQTEVLITTGSSEALDLSFRVVLNPGDEIISPDPGYPAYKAGPILAGGRFVPVPTHMEDDFQVRPSDIEARVTSRTKAILIGYPHNPTGTVLPRESLVQIGETAKRHDLLVISDEIYDRLVYDGAHTCFAALPGMRERTLHLGGFSKAYAMTGWRVGYAAGPAEVIGAMTKVHQYTMLCAPIMGQMAALEALKSGEEAVQEMVAEYNRRRRYIVHALNEMGLACFEPKGAFYAFPSIKSTGLSSEEFAERLLLEEKVAVVPGTAFGDCGEGYLRLCYAVSFSELEEAMDRMRRFVARIGR